MLGDLLRNSGEQYVARRDEKGVWHILDVTHSSLNLLKETDELPDGHPAIKILTEGEYLALVKEATRLKMISSVGGASETVYHSEIESETITKLHDTIKLLEKENVLLKQAPKRSESFELKKASIDAIAKLVGIDEIGRR